MEVARLKREKRFRWWLVALIFFLFTLVGLSTISGISRIDKAYTKLYEESLRPAFLISGLTERWYQHQLLLEEHLIEEVPEKLKVIEQQIAKSSAKIDSLSRDYQRYYVSIEESKSLSTYLEYRLLYLQSEKNILDYSRKGDKETAHQILLREGNQRFSSMIRPLHELADSDRNRGLDQFKEADYYAEKVKVSSYITLGLILLCILIWGLRGSLDYLERR